MPGQIVSLHALTVLGAALVLGACGQVQPVPPDDQPDQQTRTFDFSSGAEGFIGDFAEYSEGQNIDGVAERRTLPEPLNTGEGALFLGATNLSDDVFAFFKKEISGLEPNSTYRVNFQATIATNVPSDCVGIGGAPGESVYVKAGVTEQEPMVVLQSGDHVVTNLAKGNQSQAGDDTVLLGNVANSQDCAEGTITPYELKTLEAPDQSVTVTTNAEGEVWAVFGFDSGFEGRTEIYLDRLVVQFTEVSE